MNAIQLIVTHLNNEQLSQTFVCRVSLERTGQGNTLVLRLVTGADTGDYTCTVSALNTISLTHSLSVRGESLSHSDVFWACSNQKSVFLVCMKKVGAKSSEHVDAEWWRVFLSKREQWITSPHLVNPSWIRQGDGGNHDPSAQVRRLNLLAPCTARELRKTGFNPPALNYKFITMFPLYFSGVICVISTTWPITQCLSSECLKQSEGVSCASNLRVLLVGGGQCSGGSLVR